MKTEYKGTCEWCVATALKPTRAKDAAQSNQNHTPGPWENDDGVIYGDCNNPNGCDTVCEITNWEINPHEILTDTDKANARLISSSPDLLEACVVAEGLISERDSHAEVDISEVLGILRGAIDKATGD